MEGSVLGEGEERREEGEEGFRGGRERKEDGGCRWRGAF